MKKQTGRETGRIVAELKERKTVYEGYLKEPEQTGETQKSLADADNRLMKANGKPDMCYNVQTVADSKHRLVAEFEVTNKVSAVNRLTPVANKAKEIPEVETITAVADAGYDSVQDMVESMEQGIRPHVAGEDFYIRVPTEENQTGDSITP